MVTSSNARHARDEGALAPKPEFNIERFVKRPALAPEDAHSFLAGYAQSFARQGADDGIQANDPVVRLSEGEEVDADVVMDSFGRQFVVADMKPAALRALWALARNRDAQLGMPVVLARSEDASQWEADAPHVYFVEVPEALKPRLARFCEARAMTTDEVECLALVYLPAAGSGWVGADGRRRVSQLDSDAQYLLPMIAPFRQGHGLAWYHLVRGVVRALWMRTVTPEVDVENVPLDDLDPADLAHLLAGGDESRF